jgi:transcriptional regulator with XRE-family HTH domain
MDKYPDVQHIGKALFRRRRELGLRQVEAARLLGVEGRTLSRYERGEIERKGAVIVARIARLFGDDVDPAELARLFLITPRFTSADSGTRTLAVMRLAFLKSCFTPVG